MSNSVPIPPTIPGDSKYTDIYVTDDLVVKDNLTVSGNIIASGNVTLGKSTVTIANFAAAAATVNGSAGTIVVTDANLAADTRSTVLVVTNSAVTATSVVSVSCVNPIGSTGEPYAVVSAVAAGSFDVYVYTPINAIGATALDLDFTVL